MLAEHGWVNDVDTFRSQSGVRKKRREKDNGKEGGARCISIHRKQVNETVCTTLCQMHDCGKTRVVRSGSDGGDGAYFVMIKLL